MKAGLYVRIEVYGDARDCQSQRRESDLTNSREMYISILFGNLEEFRELFHPGSGCISFLVSENDKNEHQGVRVGGVFLFEKQNLHITFYCWSQRVQYRVCYDCRARLSYHVVQGQ